MCVRLSLVMLVVLLVFVMFLMLGVLLMIMRMLFLCKCSRNGFVKRTRSRNEWR